MPVLKVVDASAAAALLFGESKADVVAEELRGARLVAPHLFAFELASVCVVKCRKNPEQREGLLAAFQQSRALGVEEVEINHAATAELALETGLTAYDASYLWLAKELGTELVTLDKALRDAAAAL